MAEPASSAPETDPTSGPTRRRVVLVVLAAALLSAGIWGLIGSAASFSKIGFALSHAHPGWLVLSIVGVPVSYIGYALLYQTFARADRGPRPGLRVVLKFTVAVFGASILATSAARLGSEYWSLRQMRERPPQAWSRVLAINTAEWAVLAALAFAGASALLAGAGTVPLGTSLSWLIAVPVCVALGWQLTSPSRKHLAEDRGGRARRTFASALRGIRLMRRVGRHPGARLQVALGGLLHWGGELLMVWAALQAFGVSLGPAALVVGYATGYTATILPLPAGGAGGVDAAGTYALHLVGVALSPALLATLVQRTLTYWLPLAVALAAAGTMRHLGSQLADVPAPERAA